MMIWGLCCLWVDEPIRFRTATWAGIRKLPRGAQLRKLSGIVLDNVVSLERSLGCCVARQIGAFRISSQLLPLATHPDCAYGIDDLEEAEAIRETFARIRLFAAGHGLRLSFHPDQFVVPSSPRPEVAAASLRELLQHDRLAELCGATEINLHLGGVYGNKPAAIERFAAAFERWPESLQHRLTLENDDVSYTVADLLPLCRRLGVPMAYDVHHHRCNPDTLSVEEATLAAAETWRFRQTAMHCHISSPRNGWGHGNPRPHADYIDPADWPDCWNLLDAVVDVEAKAKELAIEELTRRLRLKLDL